MPKPRILIAIHYMHLGGAEISLIGLLQALDPQKVDIDLFVYSHEGELMKFIPDYGQSNARGEAIFYVREAIN